MEIGPQLSGTSVETIWRTQATGDMALKVAYVLQSPLLSLFLVRNQVALLPPYTLVLSLVSVLQLTK